MKEIYNKVSTLRVILFICTFFFISIVRSQQTQASLLNEAYKMKSASKLKLFIDRWAKSSSLAAVQWTKTANDTIKELNAVYNDFYFNDNDRVGSLWSSQYSAIQPNYLVLQDRLRLTITDSLPLADPQENNYAYPDYQLLSDVAFKEGNRDQFLEHYVPLLGLKHTVILSMSSTYYAMMENFLQAKHLPKTPNQYVDPENEGGHDEQKVNFLAGYLPMVKRHWGHYWNYFSYPDISHIVFDKHLTKAIVFFNHSSSAGIACYIKTENKWTLLDKRILIMQ